MGARKTEGLEEEPIHLLSNPHILLRIFLIKALLKIPLAKKSMLVLIATSSKIQIKATLSPKTLWWYPLVPDMIQLILSMVLTSIDVKEILLTISWASTRMALPFVDHSSCQREEVDSQAITILSKEDSEEDLAVALEAVSEAWSDLSLNVLNVFIIKQWVLHVWIARKITRRWSNWCVSTSYVSNVHKS